ncbi:MAG: histidine--tRNA ligase [Candidatus Thorarchaeota archaeon]|nr:MAG: histidine--tRNA ligase [Candidatus Thorarchaeota archaeon]
MSDMRTVRGMRDLMGPEMRIKEYLMTTAAEVFRHFGYEPLDSPVMELWETLSAKGGEDIEAETFKFKDKGDREVGLRFDLTVPLARISASNPHLPKPFRRYALGKAWRYDRPQRGRYREFAQADVDIIGSSSPAADAEVVLVAIEYLRRVLGSDYIIRINSRKVLRGLTEKAGVPDELAFQCFRAIDKLDKIGRDGVKEELQTRGIGAKQSEFLLDSIELRGSGTSILEEFASLLDGSEIGLEGVDDLRLMAEVFEESGAKGFTEFDMSLARGLDYYTGPVFEVDFLGKPKVGSLGGGGRYDFLIERLGGPPTAATGISIGIDRLIDVLAARGADDLLEIGLDVFVAPVKRPMVKYAMRIQNELVRAGISSVVDVMDRTLKKLLEQADNMKTKYMIIVGQRDLEKGEVSLMYMSTKETRQVKIDEVAAELTRLVKHG